MKSQLAARAASSTSDLVTPGDPYAMLSCTVPANKMGSWKTTPIRSRHDSGANSRMSRVSALFYSPSNLRTCTVECDPARVGVIEPAEQLLDGRFSTST